MIKQITKSGVLLLLLFCFVFEFLFSKTECNQATVPINITVEGKLIITDAQNDNKSGEEPTLNVNLELIPDLHEQVISGSSAIRIRTNLNSWKLTAQRHEEQSAQTSINPEEISLGFSVQAGSKANLNSAQLLSPFNTTTDLSKISNLGPTDVLAGLSKTSKERDPKNKDNWLELNSTYSISPDFFYETGTWNTTITYNLVSP